MSYMTRTVFALLLLLFLGNSSGNYAAQPKQKTPDIGVDTLQKMIVQSGNVTMQLDLNRLNGISSAGKTETFDFAVAVNSFFSVLVFNDQLRGAEPGSMTLVPTEVNAFGRNLPVALAASLKQFVVEKLPLDQNFDFAVRDGNSGFTFFNVEGGDYHYDANAKSLGITDGKSVT